MRTAIRTIACAALIAAVSGCNKEGGGEKPAAAPPTAALTAQAPAPPKADVDPALLGAFAPLPDVMAPDPAALTEEKIALGRMLYYDTRFSLAGDLSCNSCHRLDTYGVDNSPTSEGHEKQRGDRNSPSVYNAAGHAAQFWDGRAADVEEQAKGPVLNPVEMAMPDEASVVKVLASIPGYVEMFGKAFPGQKDAVTYDNMARAIGAFERELVTPAPFDRYLAGDAAALSDEAKKGLGLFMTTGCTACHTGALLGGQSYMKTGTIAPYGDGKDAGRFDATKNEADRGFFKVPQLRNVAKTAPYFHDGGVADLPGAVKTMAKIQLGRDLTDAEVAAMVAFLESLTGEPPAALVAAPELPPSGPKTPKPDPS